MRKSVSLPVKPARETKPVRPTAAIPEDKNSKTGQEPMDHIQKKIWPAGTGSEQSKNARLGKSSDRDHEEDMYIPTGKPW